MFKLRKKFEKVAELNARDEEARKAAAEKKAVSNVYGDDIASKAGSMSKVNEVVAREDSGKRPVSLFAEEGIQNTSGSERTKKNEKALLGNSRGTLFGN